MAKNQKAASPKQVARKKENVEREIGEGALGAIAGATVGAFAGPPGAAVGAVVGAAVGALAGAADARAHHREDDKDAELDKEIGVTDGSLGAPTLKHPPARHGLYSLAATGAKSTAGNEENQPNEGPIPHDG